MAREKEGEGYNMTGDIVESTGEWRYKADEIIIESTKRTPRVPRPERAKI
jgi:hypothetical protein